MRKVVIVSVLFHATVMAIGYFGVPFLRRTPGLTDAPILVEIVNVSDVTNPPAPKTDPEEKPEPAKKPPPPPEPPQAAALPPPKPAAEPEPEPEPEPAPEPKPEPKLEPKLEKKPEPQAKPAPPKLTRVKPRRKPKTPDAFASVRKTLEEIKRQAPRPKDEEKTKKTKPEPKVLSFEDQIAQALASPSRKHNPSRPLAISEIDLVRQQFRKCWNLPAGARDAENLVIEISVIMNPDGTVREARVVDAARLHDDPFFRASAESARRAVLNPRCNPLKLPRDKYEHWQTMTLNFNPRDMF